MEREGWRRIWVCHDPVATQVAQGVLENAGIPVRLRDLSVSPYPVSIGPLAERHLEVLARDTDQAAAILQDAVRDGILNPAR